MSGSVGKKQYEVGEASDVKADLNKSRVNDHVNVSVWSRNNSNSQSIINDDLTRLEKEG